MNTLRDIRRRLKSVENIKKITDAMGRVAAARLHRAQTKAEQSIPYISKMKEILENLALGDFTHPLLEQREVKKTGLVVISADRGLSGAYNTNILSTADNFLKKYSKDQIELILLGRKAIDYYRRRSWKVRYQKIGWGEKTTFHEIKNLTSQLVSGFLAGELDEIWLIYTHYISVMNRKVIVEKFLNIGKPHPEKKTGFLNYIFEPSAAEIFAEILPRYSVTRIQTALYEAYASELAARILAMRMASKNSEEMIDRLTLVRNKVRQSGITKEMIEISSGAEGLK
jgi:F-type H+-transporting ATPase subunit gamma